MEVCIILSLIANNLIISYKLFFPVKENYKIMQYIERKCEENA